MKHYWLIIKVSCSSKRAEVEQILRSKLPTALSIHPDEVAVDIFDNKTIMVSCSANVKTFGYSHPYSFTEESALLVEGLPTLEKFGVSPAADIPSELNQLLKRYEPQELYQKLGGVWSLGHVNKEVITVFADFCGYSSCYYYSDENSVVVGNSAKLLSLFTATENPINWRTLSWIASTTMIWSHETAFKGVFKIPPGDCLSISDDSLKPQIRSFPTNYFNPLYLPTESDKEEYLKSTITKLCHRTSWYLNRGIDINAHLTGGKDTRMALALLLGSGAIDQVKKIQTTGHEENGDVIVARTIAQFCGIHKQHYVNAGNKASTPPAAINLATRFINSMSRYEGHLTPFDGFEKELSRLPTNCPIMGGGGEIYRNKMNIALDNEETALKTFLNAYCQYDKLGLLSKEAREYQSQFLRDEIRNFKQHDIRNPEMKFYIDQRLSNWGQGHFRYGGGTQIPLLIDFDLTRLQASSKSDKSEDIHFEIIRNAQPELLKIPFLNQRWGGATQSKAALLGVDLDPISVPVNKSFPWQFNTYPKLRNVCLDNLLDNFDGFSPWLSRKAVAALRESNVESTHFNSADIKMVFGLSMAARTFSQEIYAQPDNMNGPNNEITPNMNEAAKVLFIGCWERPEKYSNLNQIEDLTKQFGKVLPEQ